MKPRLSWEMPGVTLWQSRINPLYYVTRVSLATRNFILLIVITLPPILN